MKAILTAALCTTLTISLAGCGPADPPPDNSSARIDGLEKRVAALEKATKPSRPPRVAPQAAAYKIPIGASPVLGPRGAPVNVVVFSDYQCPYCSKVDPVLRAVVDDPSLRGKVNLVFKHFPLSFHKSAIPAAKAAMAAAEQGDTFFWKMSEKIFANARHLSPERLRALGAEIGLDVDRFAADLASRDSQYDARIHEDSELGRTAARVGGTPAIYVNGWRLNNRSVDGVKALIREKGLIQ